MKKILILVFLTLFNSFSFAQWELVYNAQQVFVLGSTLSSVYAGTSSGLYKAGSDGASWSLTSLNTTYNPSAFFPAPGYILVGAGSGHGVLKSTNDGVTWSTTSLNNKAVISLWIDQGNSALCFAGTVNNGVYKSTNSGQNWTQTPLNNVTVYSLLMVGSSLMAGCGNNEGIYLSNNEGGAWSNLSLNGNVYALRYVTNNYIAGTGNGIYISSNGSNWTQKSTQYTLALTSVGDSVFAGTQNSGILLSTNRGSNWTSYNTGLNPSIGIGALCRSYYYIIAGGNGSGGNGIFRRNYIFLTEINQISAGIPEKFSLSQNYPNPFNPATGFEFRVAESGFVNLTIYNALGSKVETLLNGPVKAGVYKAEWNASSYPSGVYFYRLNADGFSETKKMMLVK